MAEIFDAIPILTVTLFAIGLIGILIYEKSRTKTIKESNN